MCKICMLLRSYTINLNRNMFSTFDNYKYLVTIAIIILFIFLGFLKHALSYWKNKNVPYVFLGNFRNMAMLVEKPYHYFKSTGHKFFGSFLVTSPLLVALHLDLIKSILTKDYKQFNSRGLYYNEKDDPLSAHLFNLEGNRWKNLRVKLTPTFTSGKMKMMFQTLVDSSKQLIEYVEESVKNGKDINIKDTLACFTTDVIGSCAFGLECNSFVNRNTNFRKYGNKIFEYNFVKSFKEGLCFIYPELSRKLGINLFANNITSFFYSITKKTVEYREQNNVTRNDFLQLLIDMRNKENLDEDIRKEFNENSLTMKEIAAQSLLFFAAGFETSSTTMTYCLYESCLHLDIQEKMRNEINDVLSRHNGEITYVALMEMTYMQQVIEETLRKHPPVPFLTRKCTEDYVIANTNTKIEKGVNVFIPVYQIHHDKEYYPEPEEFKPERFSEENKKKIPQYAFIPFGEGTRICIGSRFALMQVKVGLTKLLKNFKFTLNEKTPPRLSFDPNTFFILTSKEDIYLNVTKIK